MTKLDKMIVPRMMEVIFIFDLYLKTRSNEKAWRKHQFMRYMETCWDASEEKAERAALAKILEHIEKKQITLADIGL